jgi:predicted dehydrogenase/RimJ/RimL family protein N-acetyltransferase
MAEREPLQVGLVGAAGRGGSFRAALEAHGARIQAVCDVDAGRLDACAAAMGAAERYTRYEEMLDRSRLDAVVLGTPMPCHAPQAIAALERNVHVLCEVTAGVSVDECRQLVRAAAASKAVYMMAENYTYLKPNVLVRELCRQGLFGTPYYAEGEYLHELKELNEITRWRRTWQTGIAGVTYGTHSLGPILQWMAGDRVTRVCCQDTAHRWKDPRGAAYAQTTPVMLCRTARGALIKIRVDMLSDRPHAMTNYQLQGTEGCYESSRGGPIDRGRIWLRALSREIRWHDLETLLGVDDLAARYLPECWRHPPGEAIRAGHGGGDWFEVHDWIQAVTGKAPCPVGIHEAMDMTLPGLISQQSVSQEGAWLDVPDSRAWVGPDRTQLKMIWPADRLRRPPTPVVPEGYALRQYRPADDEAAYLALIAKAKLNLWTHQNIVNNLQHILPGGFFVVIHHATGRLVATALANHRPAPEHPHGGELGWVAADPDHKGRGLGLAVCAAATARLLSAGYTDIRLLTDDFRLPAIKVYLRLGYEPLLYRDGMAERWQKVYEALRWEG